MPYCGLQPNYLPTRLSRIALMGRAYALALSFALTAATAFGQSFPHPSLTLAIDSSQITGALMLGAPTIRAGRIAFGTWAPDGNRIYRQSGGVLTMIVGPSTA